MATFDELCQQAAREYAAEKGEPVVEIEHNEDWHLAHTMKICFASDRIVLMLLRKAILAGADRTP